MSSDALKNRPQPSTPLFQFSLARILVVTTLAAIFAAVVLPRWGDDAEGWYLLGLLVLIAMFVDTSYFYMQAGNNAMQAGKHERAVAWYGRALRVDAANPLYHYSRGCAYHALGDVDAALADFMQATRLDMQAAYAWMGRCIVEFQQKDLERALASSTMALMLDCDDPHALLTRALIYHALNRLDESRDDFDYLIRQHPEVGNYYASRGFLHSDAGRYGEALDDFREAENLGCDDDMAISRCITLFRVGRYEAALAYIAAFAASHPQHAAALTVESLFLATCPVDALRDGQRALELCNQVIALECRVAWDLDASFAAAYAELGRFEEAVEHGEAALAHTLPYRREVYQMRLEAYRARRPWRSDI